MKNLWFSRNHAFWLAVFFTSLACHVRAQQFEPEIHGMALASDGKLYVIHQDGRLKAISTDSRDVIGETQVPPPAWDGLPIAESRLYLTTKNGELLCLGK